MTRWSVQSTEEELKPVGLHSSHCWAYEVNHCGWRKLPQELHVLNVRGGVHGYEEKAVFFEKFSSITHISDVTTRWNKTPPKKQAKLLCFRTKFLSVLEQHYLLQKMTWFTQKHKMIGLKLPPLDSTPNTISTLHGSDVSTDRPEQMAWLSGRAKHSNCFLASW